MLIKILLALAAFVGAFAAYVATQPDDFRISRSMTMNAPAATIFAQVNDFHKWNDWSPWAKMDPNAKNTFEGPASGVGAAMAWAGNNDVGEGRMTIVESNPSSLIRLKLEFLKPFPATNTGEFTFKEEGGTTMVTWSMAGTSNFIGKAMGIIFNCDKMVGGQFEKGLASIKGIVEGQPK